MINPNWRRFLSRKHFEVVFESKKWGLLWGLRAEGEKNQPRLCKGTGNPPSCQRFATSTTRQASSWTANL